jgi:hypothetical protein
MDLDAPFSGQLLLPDNLLPHGETPVERGDGQMVAQIRRSLLQWRSFGILDADGTEVAEGRAAGMFRRRYTVTRADGAQLLELRLGWRGTAGRSWVTLPDGRELTVRGSTFRRSFVIRDADGTELGTIRPDRNLTNVMSLFTHAYRVTLHQPVLSVVQAVGLAQCLRKAIRSQQSGNRHRVGGMSTRGLRTGSLAGRAIGSGGGRGRGANLGSIAGGIARGVRSRRR